MKKLWIICIALFLSQLGFTYIDGRMYEIGSNESVTVGWDPISYQSNPALPIEYQYRLCMFKRSPLTYYQEGTTQNTQQTFTRPRTEFFRPEVRACGDVNGDGTIQESTECSDWANSLTHGQVDGQPKPWYIWWEMPVLTQGGDLEAEGIHIVF